MATARDVALFFACKADDEAGDNITNLKIQKLLYYAQGAHLAIHGKPLFDQQIEAWTHGPVVPDVYHELKAFGSSSIQVEGMCEAFDRLDEQEQSVVNEVYDVYGQYSAWKLRDMTHQEPPWVDTENGKVIGLDSMKQFFSTLVTQDGA